jgi:hypothetical protein
MSKWVLSRHFVLTAFCRSSVFSSSRKKQRVEKYNLNGIMLTFKFILCDFTHLNIHFDMSNLVCINVVCDISLEEFENLK